MLWADASRCLIMLSWLKWPVCSQASFPSPNVTIYILLGKLFQSIPTVELILIPEPILIQVSVPTPGLIPEPIPERGSQASSLISALIQHRGNLFPLLITENCTDTEKMKERTVWLHLPEGHLCWMHSGTDIKMKIKCHENDEKDQYKSESW